VKNVVNDNGGVKTVTDFGITTSAGSLTFDAGVAAGSTTTYTSGALTVNAASYTLVESDVAGYTEGSWSCTGADASATEYNAGAVTVPNGVAVVCTITNDDIAPTLTLIKNVINDNRGTSVATDWTLYAKIGTQTVLSGAGGVPATAVMANTAYVLSETGPAGYYTAGWTCTGGGTLTDSSITLGVGENVTCTIVNNDASSMIAPTQTTCQQYRDGTAMDYTELAYNVQTLKKPTRTVVGSVAPGVIFFWSTVTADADGAFTLEGHQLNNSPSANPWHDMANLDVFLWDANCAKVQTTTLTTATDGHPVLNVTGADPGATYYFSVKYDSSSLAGIKVAKPYPTVDYTFQTWMNGQLIITSPDSVAVKPKK